MERIASFCVDHTTLQKGMYISRTDGDITTYDLRTRRPNKEKVMENPAIHTFEHLFATLARNSRFSNQIIYFGPMGCRTGFYLLVRDMTDAEALSLTREVLAGISTWSGPIPGTSEAECGNAADHDLAGAKSEAVAFAATLKNWTEPNMKY